MNHTIISNPPLLLDQIESKCKEIGFTMPSDRHIGSLLKTLISSKLSSNFLELGTGIGLSLSWMIEGMDDNSKLTTIDNDPALIDIAQEFFGNDRRVDIICIDGTEWIQNYSGEKFDLIFADAWPGKYSELDEALALVKPGGLYVIDDMLPQPNWPEGHDEKAKRLIEDLDKRKDITLTKMDWSTGVVIAVKKS